jgi:hypothetical protein
MAKSTSPIPADFRYVPAGAGKSSNHPGLMDPSRKEHEHSGDEDSAVAAGFSE